MKIITTMMLIYMYHTGTIHAFTVQQNRWELSFPYFSNIKVITYNNHVYQP